MNKTLWWKLCGLLAGFAFVFVLATDAFAQGKGKGNGGGKGNGRGSAEKSKKSDDSLWDDDNDDKKDKNKNKQNRGRGNDDRDDWDDRDDRGNRGKGQSQRFKGLSKKTGIPAETLRARYEYERRLNPRLTYGQFVAAHMVSRNHRNVSTGDILGGLRRGRSLGQILQNKGWTRDRIDRERQRIRDIFRGDDDRDYDDRDDDWRFGF